MAKLVGADWVAGRLENPEVALVDPRRPMKYLAGHLPGAINLPVYKLFGADSRLLEPAALAEFIGGCGLDDASTALLYDSPEGQNAAMLAWILEYLGRNDVHLLDACFEAWKAAGREVRYKPVAAPARRFSMRINPSIRATLAEVRRTPGLKFVDFRSREEFVGERSMGADLRGHIPGAVNLVWRDLASPPDRLLKPGNQIERMLKDAGIARSDKVIAYCRSGPRASLGYLAMRELGYDVRLFDGSYAQWCEAGLPVEK
jgi:thiosulfate/3-mercaptopyruvate sulfurtransferase